MRDFPPYAKAELESADAPSGVLGLTRSNLADRTLIRLHRGGWDSPDVLLVDTDGGTVVVKDFAPRSPWVAHLVGRWLIRREMRMLAALAEHPAVPRLIGAIDPLAFVLEHRGGVRFTRRRPWTFSQEFGRQLGDAVAGLHARGVVHMDLRHRSNIRADLTGRPVLIDFDSALLFDPAGWAARWVMPWLVRFDLYSLRKWLERLAPARQVAARDQLSGESVSGSTSATNSVASRGASRPT